MTLQLDRRRRLDRAYPKLMRWDECAARLPTESGVMAEIGVWSGGTCSRLLAALPTLRMVLVDPWARAEPGSSYATSGSTNASKDHERVYQGCMRRLAPFEGRILVYRQTSEAAAALLNGHKEWTPLDLVFIDGDHSYEGVSTDIRCWLPKVRPGGWIGGHDFGPKKHHFPGVERAVREVFGDAFELGSDSTWWHRC